MMATRSTLSLVSDALHSVAAFTNGTASSGAVNFCMKERRVVIIDVLLFESNHFGAFLQGEAAAGAIWLASVKLIYKPITCCFR
jgi:hypothetical protein